MMKYILAAFLILTVLLPACGYHSPQQGDAWVGGDNRLMYVEQFANRTTEPYLENYITDQVVYQFSRSRMVSLTENRAASEVVLQGTVENFSTNAGSYDRVDRIVEYTASITVNAKLINVSDGKILWQKSLSSSEVFPATVNKNLQLEGQDLAAREISARLGEDLYAQMFSNF